MKRRILVCLLCSFLCVSFSLVSLSETNSYPLASTVANIERNITEARVAFQSGDREPLSKPIVYKVLWLGYTHVTFGGLDFQMTSSDRDYLKAVVLNFEKYLEKITGHNLEVKIKLRFVDKKTPLTQWPGDNSLYLAKETIMPEANKYLVQGNYDTILTTVQTAGSKNANRNKSKAEYNKYYVMLGLKTHGINDDIGYSTFDLGEPIEGTYPLKDPEVPSLFATAVAVHEWLHQLEYLGTLLDIEYPDTHAYMGPPEFPEYKKVRSDEKNYDFFEFYDQVLTGTVPYNKDGKTQYIGLYPKMLPLLKRGTTVLGTFTIRNQAGQYLCGRKKDPKVTLSKKEHLWVLIYNGNGRIVFIPSAIPEWRLDLSNAWDDEGNTVSLWDYTGYEDAQSWKVTENGDGSVCIRTPYSSGRALTIPGRGKNATIQNTDSGPILDQCWFFTKLE